jgi:hypothetical protein
MLIQTITCISLFAQQPPPDGGHRPGPPPVPPVFAALDTNHDRVLSEDEIQAAVGALAALDKNLDGKITLEELRMPPPVEKDAPERPPGPPRHPAPPIIATLDANHDGTISADELANAPESLKELDKDGNGELSPEELRPHGPPPPRGEEQPYAE